MVTYIVGLVCIGMLATVVPRTALAPEAAVLDAMQVDASSERLQVLSSL